MMRLNLSKSCEEEVVRQLVELPGRLTTYGATVVWLKMNCSMPSRMPAW
jgi:hypothetical protein